MRLLAISLGAGAAAFLTMNILMDLSVFSLAPQAELLRAPEGGLSGAAAQEYADWSSWAYWIAALVTVIVLAVTPVVRWSNSWAGPEEGPPFAPDEDRPAPEEWLRRRPPELWPDAETERRWTPVLAAPSAAAPAAAAQEPEAPAPEETGAGWAPRGNSYSEALRRRYGSALRPVRKLSDEQRRNGPVKEVSSERKLSPSSRPPSRSSSDSR